MHGVPNASKIETDCSSSVPRSFAATVSAWAKEGEEARSCETKFGGQVVCGDLVVGITLEQYEAGLNKRAEEIRAEEAEKRVQLQKLMELTERATDAEKGSLRSEIAAIEAEKRALEAEGKGIADRLTNLQASYDSWCRNSPRPMPPWRHLHR